MSNEILPLNIKIQPFLNKTLEKNLNGFILNYKNVNYLISVHHNLPIDSVYNSLNDDKLSIKIDSCWSEILIMDTHNIDLNTLCINHKVQNRIPKPNEIMSIKTNDQRYQTQVIDYKFIPYDTITEDLSIPYIRSKLNENIKVLSGLSGSPVFIDDKLVGIFSKFDEVESIAYIIPIYIVIRNLKKKDNANIYGLPVDIKINKINSYNINNNLIYHPTLKIIIPVSTFLMLECDRNSKISVCHDTTNIMISHMITKPIKLNIPNESFIINKDFEYKLNLRLLILLKKINMSKQKINFLINYIGEKSDSNNVWFSFQKKLCDT